MKKLLSCFILLSLINVSQVLAWAPPAGTPLAELMHPRILFVPESYKAATPNAMGYSVGEMRSKLVDYYNTEFQEFINEMDIHFSDTVIGKDKLYTTHEIIDYAFLYMLDPSQMSNFTFEHTKAEYGQHAKDLALYCAGRAASETAPFDRAKWLNYLTSKHNDVQDGPIDLSLAIATDWLHDILTLSEKRNIANALFNTHSLKPELNLFSGEKHFGQAQNGLGVIGLDGPELDEGNGTYYKDKIAAILNEVDADILTGGFDFYEHVYGGSAMWYSSELYTPMYWGEIMKIAPIMGTLLNKDYYSNYGHLRDSVIRSVYANQPLKDSYGYSYELSYADGAPQDDVDTYVRLFNESITHSIGHTRKKSPELAAIGKWFRDNSIYATKREPISRYGGYRLWYIWSVFFAGANEVTAHPPVQLSKKLGGGLHTLRSGFTSENDTLITFWANEYNFPAGHVARGLPASFSIHKHGGLAVDRGASKSFSGGNLHETNEQWTKNAICVVNPSDTGDVFGSYRIDNFDWDMTHNQATHPSWQYDGKNNVGKLLNSDLEGINYDYIQYDYSNAWDDSRVTDAQREFIYMRSAGGSNDEYVITYDKVESFEANADKYYLLQSTYLPSVSGTISTITNNGFSGVPAHGRLINKTLLPENASITIKGGPGRQFLDFEDDVIWGGTFYNEREKYDRGEYVIRIKSNNAQNFTTFLNVMQFGDSNTLTSMDDTSLISTTGMVGAHIKNQYKNNIIMFNSASDGSTVTTVSYNVSPSTSSQHILTGMQKNTIFNISINGTSTSATSNTKGILRFVSSTTGSTDFIISASSETGSNLPLIQGMNYN